MIGVSTVPFGDLSVSSDLSDASVAAFLFSNSIVLVQFLQNPPKLSQAE